MVCTCNGSEGEGPGCTRCSNDTALHLPKPYTPEAAASGITQHVHDDQHSMCMCMCMCMMIDTAFNASNTLRLIAQVTGGPCWYSTSASAICSTECIQADKASMHAQIYQVCNMQHRMKKGLGAAGPYACPQQKKDQARQPTPSKNFRCKHVERAIGDAHLWHTNAKMSTLHGIVQAACMPASKRQA